MNEFIDLLKGGDLRILRGTNEVIARVKGQDEFDALFKLLFHHERTMVMRAADAVEKITRFTPQFLTPHKTQLLELMKDHAMIELKWHLAQLAPRLDLTESEVEQVWVRLRYWTLNRSESKIVRVHALQAMFDISQSAEAEPLKKDFRTVVGTIERECIPSIDARIRKLRTDVRQMKKSHRLQPHI
jgi:hypothetical protein